METKSNNFLNFNSVISMANTTNISSSGITTYSIKIEGNEISDEIGVLSILVDKEVNTIARAKIILLDDNARTGEFEVSCSSTFVPGNKVSIEAGYDYNNNLIFEGIICEHNIRIHPERYPTLEIVCYDESIKTTVGRNSKTFIEKTDSDIMSSVLGDYSISTNISSTTPVLSQVVQYDATDWDFILSRAEANGLLVRTVNGKISAKKPDANTSSVLTLKYGYDIIALDANLRAINQLEKVKSTAWHYSSQSLISKEIVNDYPGPGNLSAKTLSKVIGLETFDLQSPAPMEIEELGNWNKAQLVKSNYSKIQGLVTHLGTSEVEVGNYITLEGVGERFNGDHFVSKVVHNISEGNWMTTCAIGLSEESFTKQNKTKSNSPSGLLSGVHGLFTATVKKIDEDPENQFRILVDIPLFNDSGDGLWARHSSFYASNNAGAFFMPEIGDEVVVGFLNEDPRFPIILGSLYSNPNLKPSEGLNPNKNNSTKAIVSKSGIAISFDDENRIFTITTPDKNTIVFSDADKQITIQDQNSNTITMSKTGIALKSPKSISIDSEEKVSIIGAQGISLKAQGGDVNVEGLNIQHKAGREFSAEGSASASLETNGNLTIKGSLVQIN